MKIVVMTLVLSIMIVMNTPLVSSTELVRGGNLDTVEERLAAIEEHHVDLEYEESLLEALKTKPAMFSTEVVMETAVDKNVYSNKWDEPRAQEDQYV